MEHTPEELEHLSFEHIAEEKQPYVERPKHHIVMAWIGIIIVLFAFLGTCYWMVNF